MSAIAGKSPSSPAPVLGGDVGRIEPSSGKATPNGPSFGTVLANAKPILKGAESAASVLPGGPLLAAAVKGSTTLANVAGPSAAAGSPGSYGSSAGGIAMVPRPMPGSASSSPVPAAPSLGGSPNPTAFVGAPGDASGNMDSLLADSQAFNLYYLQLQEEMSAENRSYTALSNVLKARHDTVKNAIGNIR